MLNILNKRLIIKYNNLRRLCSTQSKNDICIRTPTICNCFKCKIEYSVPYVCHALGVFAGIIIGYKIFKEKKSEGTI